MNIWMHIVHHKNQPSRDVQTLHDMSHVSSWIILNIGSFIFDLHHGYPGDVVVAACLKDGSALQFASEETLEGGGWPSEAIMEDLMVSWELSMVITNDLMVVMIDLMVVILVWPIDVGGFNKCGIDSMIFWINHGFVKDVLHPSISAKQLAVDEWYDVRSFSPFILFSLTHWARWAGDLEADVELSVSAPWWVTLMSINHLPSWIINPHQLVGNH